MTEFNVSISKKEVGNILRIFLNDGRQVLPEAVIDSIIDKVWDGLHDISELSAETIIGRLAILVYKLQSEIEQSKLLLEGPTQSTRHITKLWLTKVLENTRSQDDRELPKEFRDSIVKECVGLTPEQAMVEVIVSLFHSQENHKDLLDRTA